MRSREELAPRSGSLLSEPLLLSQALPSPRVMSSWLSTGQVCTSWTSRSRCFWSCPSRRSWLCPAVGGDDHQGKDRVMGGEGSAPGVRDTISVINGGPLCQLKSTQSAVGSWNSHTPWCSVAQCICLGCVGVCLRYDEGREDFLVEEASG